MSAGVTARSALAAVHGDRVRALQHALYRAAKADPGRRFHVLFDKIHRRDVLDRAWEDVRRNRGAAGIDRVSLADAEEYGVSRLLGELDSAVSGFLADLAKDPRGSKVVVAVYSEFGRRVAANASQGTDHGTAGPLLVAGRPVRGGFSGDQPSLTALDDGDLKVTTDFRSVYATLLEQVLATDPARVLDSARPTLDLLR